VPRANKTGVRGLHLNADGRYDIDLRWKDPRTGEYRRHSERVPLGLSAEGAKAYASAVLRKLLIVRRSRGIGVVYFLAIGGCLKIGYTNNIDRRLSEYASHNPHPPVLLASIRGTHADERRWQLAAEPHRIRGEFYSMEAWDELRPKVRPKVEDVCA
jgi:hypothetical protein